MIIGDDTEFFIQFDILIDSSKANGYALGPFNFWIDGVAYPGKGPVITLNSVLPLFIWSFEKAVKWKFKGSNLPIKELDFDDEEINERNTMYWPTVELFDYGLSLQCEIVGENIRLFYKQGNAPYQEKVIPLAYYKNMMDELESWMHENLL